MAQGKGGGQKPAKGSNSDRKSGKGNKKNPKVFDPVKRRLVTKTS